MTFLLAKISKLNFRLNRDHYPILAPFSMKAIEKPLFPS